MKTWIPAIALAILAALVVRNLFPKERTVIVPGPPAVPDTILVPGEIDLDTIFVTRTDTVFTTDTLNLTHTVHITDTLRLTDTVAARSYLDRLSAPLTLGDTLLASMHRVGVDSTGAWRVASVERLWTPGYITGIDTRNGLRIDFEPFPEPASCGRGWWGLGGFAAGVLTWELVR